MPDCSLPPVPFKQHKFPVSVFLPFSELCSAISLEEETMLGLIEMLRIYCSISRKSARAELKRSCPPHWLYMKKEL